MIFHLVLFLWILKIFFLLFSSSPEKLTWTFLFLLNHSYKLYVKRSNSFFFFFFFFFYGNIIFFIDTF